MKRDRGQLAIGLVLILVGAWFVAVNQVPELVEWANPYTQWPLNIITIGAALLLVGLIVGAPGMAVPAAIVAGVGGILTYQTNTGDWESWSYLWTLIPGFVGVGEILHGVFTLKARRIREGMNTLAGSAVLFLIFASIFGKLDILGGSFGVAALLIVIGLWMVVNGLLRKRGVQDEK